MQLDARHKLLLVLAGIFSTCLIVGDIIGGKLIEGQVFGHTMTTTVGMIPFPITFLLTDVLNEFYGKRVARFVTLVAFGLALLSLSVIYIAGAVPIASMAKSADWTGVTESSFANVFLGSQRMMVASLTAFLVSQFTDIFVFNMLKRATGKRFLWLRATGSTLVSQLIDTITITFVAWSGMMSVGKIINIISSAYVLKILIALSLTPLIYVCHALVQRGLGLQPIALSQRDDATSLTSAE
jgi:uncharacterized integral membrane protein (TIGR00697 family)